MLLRTRRSVILPTTGPSMPPRGFSLSTAVHHNPADLPVGGRRSLTGGGGEPERARSPCSFICSTSAGLVCVRSSLLRCLRLIPLIKLIGPDVRTAGGSRVEGSDPSAADVTMTNGVLRNPQCYPCITREHQPDWNPEPSGLPAWVCVAFMTIRNINVKNSSGGGVRGQNPSPTEPSAS